LNKIKLGLWKNISKEMLKNLIELVPEAIAEPKELEALRNG